jgi:non-specific serine/threonine protein kinase/serine/threonine-protein kinase
LSFEELRRKLREVDPPTPSTKLAALERGASEAARRRSTDPDSLRRTVQGDLDAIVMKALEKERSRRYGTATELAADLTRFLGHEPVLARAPSRAYRLQKYVRRHALGVGVAAVLVVLLAGLVTMMTFQFHEIARERDRANAERDRASAERDLARTWVQHVADLVGNAGAGRTEWAPSLNPAYVSALDAVLHRAEELLTEGRASVALQLSRDTLALALKESKAENLYTVWARTVVGEALIQQGLFSDAETTLRDAYPLSRDALHGELAGRTCVDLARALILQGKRADAIGVLKDALENGLQRAVTDALAKGKDTPGTGRLESLMLQAETSGGSQE